MPATRLNNNQINAFEAYSFTTTNVITRNAQALAYIADDVWGTRFTISLPLTSNGTTSLLLTTVNLKTSLTTLPTNFGSFRLFLFYTTTEAANIGDNEAFTRRLEAIDYDGYLLNQIVKATNDPGGRSTTYDLNVPIYLPDTTTQLFGYIVTNIGYTPLANADTITIKSHFLVL